MTNTAGNIKIADIESELNRLWESQEKKGSTRACLFNLIIYSSTERRVNYLEDMAQTIIKKFPCRLIFIRGNESVGSNYLNVSVSTVSSGAGNDSIACDQINIEVGYKLLERVPFLVLPHLIPDLPVYLLWGQDPTTENEILPHLEKFADRLIFDSDCAKDLQMFSIKLLKMIEKSSGEILDLNWAMLFGWREAFSMVFNSKESLDHMAHAKAIHITYNAKKNGVVYHPEIRAVYLLGWIASQMNWRFKSIEQKGNLSQTVFSSDNGNIIISLFPQEENETVPGNILGVEISTYTDHYYSFTRVQAQSKIVIHISSAEACDLPITIPLPDTKRGFTFLKELFYYSPCDSYKRMLTLLSEINWQGVCDI